MEKEENQIKKYWNWLWHSESIWSYLVFLVLVYIFIKLIFFPTLAFIFGSSMPLAIVESSSMDHTALQDCINFDAASNTCLAWSVDYALCGSRFNQSKSLNSEDYWKTCGAWYEQNTNITSVEFQNYKFKNGFKKGDILIIMKKRAPKIGDVILFRPNKESLAPNPIIHRLVLVNEGGLSYQTKGDHNEKQLQQSNNAYKTDETRIKDDQVLGIAVARIPYLGWAKLFFVELFKKIF